MDNRDSARSAGTGESSRPYEQETAPNGAAHDVKAILADAKEGAGRLTDKAKAEHAAMHEDEEPQQVGVIVAGPDAREREA